MRTAIKYVKDEKRNIKFVPQHYMLINCYLHIYHTLVVCMCINNSFLYLLQSVQYLSHNFYQLYILCTCAQSYSIHFVSVVQAQQDIAAEI